MVRVDYLKRRIRDIEGFHVQIQGTDGNNLRGDYEGARTYEYKRAARDSWTVAKWIRERFHDMNPQFNVIVLDSNGSPVTGGYTLGTVRGGY